MAWGDMREGFTRDPVTGALYVELQNAGNNPVGQVQIEDKTNAGNLLTVNADGSINVNTVETSEVATAAAGAANPAQFKVIAGTDGTNVRAIKTDTSGLLQVDLGAPIPAGSNNIGVVTLSSGIDVTDRVARSLGVVSVTGTVDVSDRAARAAGSVQLADPTVTTQKAAVSAAGAVKVDGSAATQPVSGTFWQNTQPVSGTVTSNQGTAAAISSAWPAKLTDGTSTQAIKAASTAAVAGDQAAVVAISPNNSVSVTGTFWQNTQPVSGTVTGNQGTANTTANAWPAKVTDGTNIGAVKAASTAAGAADPALVVAVSPNNSVSVTGAFWQATQPVSAVSLPLPAGAATDANLVALDLDLNNNRRNDERLLLEMRQVSVQLAALTGIASLGDSGGF